jgi:hypothetical protein
MESRLISMRSAPVRSLVPPDNRQPGIILAARARRRHPRPPAIGQSGHQLEHALNPWQSPVTTILDELERLKSLPAAAPQD